MIIGNNTNSIKKDYKNFSSKLSSTTLNKKTSLLGESLKAIDMRNKKEMDSQAFDVLQERLNQGLISLEEFNIQCNKLRNNK